MYVNITNSIFIPNRVEQIQDCQLSRIGWESHALTLVLTLSRAIGQPAKSHASRKVSRHALYQYEYLTQNQQKMVILSKHLM